VLNGNRGSIQDNDSHLATSLNANYRIHVGPVGAAVGISGYDDTGSGTLQKSWGAYGDLTWKRLTWLGELDLFDLQPAGLPSTTGVVTSHELSVQIRQGIDALATYDFYDPDRWSQTGAKTRWGGGVSVMPRSFAGAAGIAPQDHLREWNLVFRPRHLRVRRAGTSAVLTGQRPNGERHEALADGSDRDGNGGEHRRRGRVRGEARRRQQSRVRVEGDDGDVRGKTKNLSGTIVVDPAAAFDSMSVHLEVDLTTLDTGIAKRNQHMRDHHLETSKYPKAVFDGAAVTGAQGATLEPGKAATFDCEGTFSLHGVSRRLHIPVEATYTPKGAGRHDRVQHPVPGRARRLQHRPAAVPVHEAGRHAGRPRERRRGRVSVARP
jgi:hypothetical protein